MWYEMNHQGYRTMSNRQWIVPKKQQETYFVPVILLPILYNLRDGTAQMASPRPTSVSNL